VRIVDILERIMDGNADHQDLELLRRTAQTIWDTADCTIGSGAARIALDGLKAFEDDFHSHINNNHCLASFKAVPCRTHCPAHIDIPAYIALEAVGRHADAVRIVRNNNPFPSVCAYICEHPCETACRRGMVDDPINIRGIKLSAVDTAGEVPIPVTLPSTGKTIAVVGGGPSGLTAAYYLALMGHSVTVYEQNSKLGGMLRYGIPRYRLPAANLDYDINAILRTGIEVKFNVSIGKDLSIVDLKDQYDSVYVAIGAQSWKLLRISGEDIPNAISAVNFLNSVEQGNIPDVAGKKVIVVGGGNVAMDACRTALRLGAERVQCVYRRRRDDMTALENEVEAAAEEGVDMVTLQAPLRIEVQDDTVVLVTKPQIPGEYAGGRPKPVASEEPEQRFSCDVIITAIGQDIESGHFEEAGMKTQNGKFVHEPTGIALGFENVYVGGDCATGPATVIRAIEAGKVVAANIDKQLGYHHSVEEVIDIPVAQFENITQCGRANITERPALDRVHDFDGIEVPLTTQETLQEANRCLRCDHFGLGSFRDGRSFAW
jgi:NADPH-dependent glutamate synthase beta subunit-like oxidoreductase